MNGWARLGRRTEHRVGRGDQHGMAAALTHLSRWDIGAGCAVALAIGAAAVLTIGGTGAVDAVSSVGIACLAAGIGLAWVELRKARRAAAHLSGELSVMSGRLLRLEAQVGDGRSPGRSGPATVFEVLADDLGIVGGAVRSLAEAVREQERELATLRKRLDARPETPPAREDAAARDPNREGDAPLRPQATSVGQLPSDEAGVASLLAIPTLFRDPGPATRPAAHPRDTAFRPDGTTDELGHGFKPGNPVHDDLARHASEARRDAVETALADGRVELYVQPIVSLPQRRPIFGEVLARLRLADGSLLEPAEFMPEAERLGLLSRLDGVVVDLACGLARNWPAGPGGPALSVNLAPPTLADSAALSRICDRIAELPSGRLVVEIPQRAWSDPALRPGLAFAASAGLFFAIDGVFTLALDPGALAARNVRYVKIGTDQLLAPARVAETSTEEVVAGLAHHGIVAIAEGIEREPLVPELIEIGLTLAQGYLFGQPLAVPAERSAAPAVASGPAATVDPPVLPSPPEEVRSLRSLLRRAG